MPTWNLWHGDNREMLRETPDNSIDSGVMDPPYEIAFMSKKWDATGIAFDITFWKEVYRVLKPGAHLVAFSGTRTYHRMVCAIEDAGFEIRDQLAWVYGQGFPKSLDVSKAIDKAAGAERSVVGSKIGLPGYTLSVSKGGEVFGGFASKTAEHRLKETQITAPSTDAAKQWQGWGTALKPAQEPIVLARKPLAEGTVAANVLTHGVGAMNIDGCRVATNGEAVPINRLESWSGFGQEVRPEYKQTLSTQGRFPANLIHDGSSDVLAAFPDAPGQLVDVSTTAPSEKTSLVYGRMKRASESGDRRLDSGSAARFFPCCPFTDAERLLYHAKANKKDRNGSKHPTVKPVALMRWLCRLVTPPGGMVLDAFAGSGTTGEAALLEGFNVTLAEQEAEYAADIEQRLKGFVKKADKAPMRWHFSEE